ncbi:MAG: TonB-dependent receptor [Gammaproteobacteria bacterium]|jgi:iron complex outermembrane receptor protein|nr:TonB-dependent receptor [Gammaproteobacteria bacterium]
MLNTYGRTVQRAVRSSLLASALTVAAAAHAQQPAEEEIRLDEVTVTASRGASATDLQSTPISVSAVTSADIDRLVAKDISGLASAVPGFSAARITAFNAASFAMRGVGLTDIIVYQDSPVGVQVDDFVMPSVQTQLLDTFDIEGAEVLRGPQGTLFGKNTTGGAVNIRTKRPNMSEFGAQLRLGYGSFGSRRIQAAVDLPLQQDVFALRLVGSIAESDGYYKLGATYGPINTLNIFGGTFAPFNIPGVTGQKGAGTGETTGGDDVVNGRIKAQWNVSDDLTVLLQVEKMRDRSDAVPAFNDTPPGGPYLWNVLGFTRPTGDPLDNMGSTQRGDSLLAMDKGQKIDVDGVYLNVEWDLGAHRLFAVAGSRDQDEHLPNTYTGAAPINSITKQPLSLFDATRDTTRETKQIEVRLASDTDGAFKYVVGGFQQTNDAKFCVVQLLGFIDLALPFAALGLPAQFNNNTPQVLCNQQDSDSLAGFVDLTYQVSDKFQLGAGFRHTKDEREWAGRTQVGFGALDPKNPNLTAAQLGNPLAAGDFTRYPGGQIVNASTKGFENLQRSWSEPSWRLTGSYQWTDSLFSYLTISRGYKAGGYNDQTGTSGLMVPSLTRPVDPEYATNYEFGLKFESEDGRFRFNPTVFSTLYEDAQRAVNIITKKGGADFQETVFYNAAEVKSQGIELEMQALVTDSFRIRGQAAFLDAKYDKFVITQPGLVDAVSGGQIVAFNGDFSGLPVPRSPKTSGAISGTYTTDLASGSLDVTGEVYYEDANLFYISAAGRQYDAYLDEKTLLNLSVTYTDGQDRFFVRAYGKNLSDERYRVASQSVATLWTHTQWGAPRSYGIEVGVNFGGK